MSTTKPTRDHVIRAAGVTQAVIASGAPIEEWPARVQYGLNLSNCFAFRLAGAKDRKPPPVPKSLLKERK